MFRHLRRVAMRTAEGFLEDLIDEPELRQALRGQAHGIRSGFFFSALFTIWRRTLPA